MGKSLSQLEATQAVAVALQRQITDLEQQQAAILKLATKWAKTKIPDRYSLDRQRAQTYKYCGRRILRILEQKDEK